MRNNFLIFLLSLAATSAFAQAGKVIEGSSLSVKGATGINITGDSASGSGNELKLTGVGGTGTPKTWRVINATSTYGNGVGTNVGALTFYNNSDAIIAGLITPTGAFAIGPATGIGDTSQHLVNGALRLNTAATGKGSVSTTLQTDLSVNLYRDSTGGVRGLSSTQGYGQMTISRVTSVNSDVFNWFVDVTDTQTAGAVAVTTNEISAGGIDGGGRVHWRGVIFSHNNRAMVGGGSVNGLDVEGISNIRFNAGTAGTYTINGFANGTAGQILYIMKITAASDPLVIAHNNASGTQKIFTKTGSNISISGVGGRAFIFDNAQWLEL